MTATEQVILVDENDHQIGVAEKMHAHENNLLHRAFSVFIYRTLGESETEILLQQRASDKYHCANLWTNACCSHPRPNETIRDAALRRLNEEMGLITELHELGWFHYQADFKNGLSENENDYVLIGNGGTINFTPNYKEIKAYQWIKVSDLVKNLEEKPQNFTPWLKPSFMLVLKHLQEWKIINEICY